MKEWIEVRPIKITGLANHDHTLWCDYSAVERHDGLLYHDYNAVECRDSLLQRDCNVAGRYDSLLHHAPHRSAVERRAGLHN